MLFLLAGSSVVMWRWLVCAIDSDAGDGVGVGLEEAVGPAVMVGERLVRSLLSSSGAVAVGEIDGRVSSSLYRLRHLPTATTALIVVTGTAW